MSQRLSHTAPSGEQIVAHVSPGRDDRVVVFVPGFRSVCAGTKATWFEARAVAAGITYARFDFRGMGESEGRFEEMTIGREVEDLALVLDHFESVPVYLIGSSLGGMVSVLTAQTRPQQIRACLLIAPAFDFFDRRRDYLGTDGLEAWRERGIVEAVDQYTGEPYRLRYDLISDGVARQQAVWDQGAPCPVRIFHGSEDEAVPMTASQRFLREAPCPDCRLTVIDGGDHRLLDHLPAIWQGMEELLAR
ncbi:MAG: alpha/beta fold hydrolase [Nitrospirota bacterium]|jgi:pimeloyl-ACP methyl ester carboxylesterase